MVIGNFLAKHQETFEKICVLSWCLWWERNQVRFHGMSRAVEVQVEFALCFLEEFKKSKLVN